MKSTLMLVLLLLFVTVFTSCKRDDAAVKDDVSNAIYSLKFKDVRGLAFSELSMINCAA